MDKLITLSVSDLLAKMNRCCILLALLAVVAVLFSLMPATYFEMAHRDFLPLHTALEFSSILVAFMIFGVTWHSLSPTRSANITLLGCAMLASGLLDFGHALSYKGMPDFVTPASPEKGIAFWLAARLTVATALCATSFMTTAPLQKPQIRYLQLLGYSLYTVFIYWLVLFHQSVLPRTFIEGHGLTHFKVACEWGIIGLLGIAGSRFWRGACNTGTHELKTYFFTAAVVFVMSEVFFTQYKTMSDAFNILGHLYKIIADFLLYQAVFVTTIQAPYYEIEQQQTRYRQLFDNMTSCAVVYQAVDNGGDFIFLEVNHAAERTEKISRHEFIGRRVTKLFPAIADFGLLEVIRRVWRTGQPEQFPVKYYQDERIAGWRTSYLYRLADGNVVAIYNDITERKVAEQALQESEKNFRAIFETAAIGMAETDSIDGKFLHANTKFCQMVGYSAQELLSMTFAMITHPDDRDMNMEGWRRMANGDIPEYVVEKRYIHKDGHIVWVHVNVVALRDENDKIYRTLAAIADITERKLLEQQLLQAQKMEALGQLTGGIAHDFNNILAAILGYSNLALERCVSDPSDKLARYLGEVISASERARDLIAKMLAYSRTSSVMTSVPLDMSPEVKKALAILSAAIPAGIEVSTRIEPDLPPVRIDPVEIQQVLINLAVNARDAIGEQGRIDISLERVRVKHKSCAICHTIIEGDFVALEVKDSGDGILAEIQQRIFDPFFTTKDVGKGSGLGLSMVQGVVIKNNAHLLLESSFEHGTSFRLLFPFADAKVDLSAPLTAKPIAPITKHWRVWVVEDQEALAGYYLELLQEQGYLVTVFIDPVNALHTFQLDPNSVDLILTDQTMPYLSGAELAEAVLAIKPNLPIILVTGYTESINADEAKRRGIRYFLNKPVDGKKLLEILAAELCNNDLGA